MAKKLQLSIPTPCHENWDAMTPVEKGKFCGSCQKKVVDFSNMSDRQVAEFFKKPILSLSKGSSVCGRFMSDQLERDIEIPRKRIPWLKYFFQFAIPAFLISMKTTAGKTQGKVAITNVSRDAMKLPQVLGNALPVCSTSIMGDTTIAPIKKSVNSINKDKQVKKDKASKATKDPFIDTMIMGLIAPPPHPISPPVAYAIFGHVIDENGEPIPFASIETNGSGRGLMADEKGSFGFGGEWLRNDSAIVVSSAGFESKTINTKDEKNRNKELIVQLKSNVVLPEVVVAATGIINCSRLLGSVSIVKGQTIAVTDNKAKDVQKKNNITPDAGKLFVYPIPVASGTSVNLSFNKMEEGYYRIEFVNLNGQMIHQKEIWIDAEARVLQIDIPPVAAGSYFLTLINKKSGKRFTEKIIVL